MAPLNEEQSRLLTVVQVPPEFCQGFEAKACGIDMPCYLGVPLCTEVWPKLPPEPKVVTKSAA